MQGQREDIFPPQIMAWYNSRISSYGRSVEQVLDFTDGTAFLLILAEMHPNFLQYRKIILLPKESSQVKNNLRLLAATLHKVGESSLILLAKKIGEEIGKGSKNTKPIIDLVLHLYSMFGMAKTKLEYVEKNFALKRINAIPPANLSRQLFIMKQKTEIKNQDITQLHSISRTKSNTIQKPKMQENPIKMENPCPSSFILIRCQQTLAIMKQKQASPTQYRKNHLLKRIIGIIISCLKTKNINVQQPKSAHTANNLNFFSQILFKLTMETTSSQKIPVSEYCKQILKSTDILKYYFSSSNKLNQNLFLLKYAKNFQDLSSRLNKKNYFFKLQTSIDKMIKDQMFFQQTSHSKHFWTEHLIVLIAIQLRYVDTGILRGEQKKQTHKKKQCKFIQGFTCFLRREQIFKGDQISNTQAIIQQNQYRNLTELFARQADKQAQAHQSYDALRKLISVMLELKHQSAFGYFVKLYDEIVGEIITVKIRDIHHPEDRFRIVDQITEKVKKNGRDIEDFLMKGYLLRTDSRETDKLINSTVYCFLAELNGFSVNEMYCEAFNFANQDNQQLKEEQKELIKIL